MSVINVIKLIHLVIIVCRLGLEVTESGGRAASPEETSHRPLPEEGRQDLGSRGCQEGHTGQRDQKNGHVVIFRKGSYSYGRASKFSPGPAELGC